MRKKWIKGSATDGPIIESPYFSRIQWNQSLSHMPRATLEPKLMDIPEMAAEQEIAVEPERAAEQEEPEEEEEEEYEEMITLRASDFLSFQDILEDMRF
jgi:hypothetical protein